MPTISCTTAFNLRTSPKVFLFTDTTDWAGQSIATADVNGCIKIVPPSGIPYYNNGDFSNAGCDIWIDNALANQIPISLPMSGGIIQPGTYTIIYSVYNSDTAETYTQEYTFVYSYVQPTLSISQLADCLSPLFSSTDNTVYAITGAELTLERTHTLYFPAGSAGAGSPVVNTSPTNPSITSSTLYNGTQTTTIASLMTYVFTDGLIIMDSLSGSREELVNCRDICSITCCITAFETRMNAVRERNYDLYLTDYKYQWLEMMGYVGMIKCLAIPCGVSNDKISYFMEQIQKIGNCTDDCCTEADDYSQVIGLGVINVNVVSGGTPVEVTAVVASGTTTFTITLDAAFVARVVASYNTIVAAGQNVTSVTVVTAGDGTKTYTVNAKKSIVDQDYGISVDVSTEVAGVTTYTVSVALTERAASSIVAFDVPIATGTLVTGCTITVPEAGQYLVFAEADLAAQNLNLVYRLVKNDVTEITANRNISNVSLAGAITNKMCTPVTKVTLAMGDTIKFKVDSDALAIIGGRSITLLRIV